MRRILLLAALPLLSAIQLMAQRTVNGVVTDASSGETIPGVGVRVQGTVSGTVTDVDGKYTIEMPSGFDVLVFSFVGMKTVEITVTSNTVDVKMEVDPIGIDEVVVTGIGISREVKALGYSTQEIAGEDLIRANEANVIQALAAKSAGVQIIGSGGTPGSSSKILIRGNHTFTGDNQPLIVIDGIPMDNSTESTVAADYPFNPRLNGVNNSNRALDINPEDIESITVLKGPAAAAIYGYRAGNGAVVITTKRGQATQGRGIVATYSTSLEISKVNKLPELQSTYGQGNGSGSFAVDSLGDTTFGGAAVYISADPGPDLIHGTGDDLALGTANSWGPNVDTLGVDGAPFDNPGNFFQTGVSWSNNLSLTGGTANTMFRASVHRLKQTGIVPNSEFNRSSVRLTADSKLTNRFRFGGTADYIRSGGTKVQNGSNLSGVMLGLLRAPVTFDLEGDPSTYDDDIDGNEGYLYPQSGAQRQYFFIYDNPFWTVYENPFTDEINRVIGNVYLTYAPLPWMDITYRIGTDVYSDRRKQIFAVYSWDPASAPFGQIEENTITSRRVYADLLVNIERQISDNIGTTITVGQNTEQSYFKDLYARGRTLAIPQFYNMSNASDLYTSEGTEIVRTAAVFADVNFDIKRMLYLGVTGRVDWASTFGPNKRAFPFYAANASFILSELLNDNKILSFAKIRLAYSNAGIAPPAYQTVTYFTQPFFTDGFTDGVGFPYGGVNGFGYSDRLGNANLEPERVGGPEIGFDLRFLNGRANLDFTWYSQKSTNLLVARPIASSTGFEELFTNIGEMINTGIEIVASGTPVQTKSFEWEIMVNFAKNKNQVLELAPGVGAIDIETAFESIGSFAIIDPGPDDSLGTADDVGQPYGALYGDLWVRDSEGNLVINPQTGLPYVSSVRGNLGNPFPDWTMGISNTFKFKNLTVSALLDIRQGGDLWSGTMARMHRYGRSLESEDRLRTYVVPGVLAATDSAGNVIRDPETNDPIAGSEDNTIAISALSYYRDYKGDLPQVGATENAIFDGSWVRLREVAISYFFELPASTPAIAGLELQVSARNLWLKTNFPGVDPETSLTGAGSNVNGFEYFNNPGQKSYTFTLRAQFR